MPEDIINLKNVDSTEIYKFELEVESVHALTGLYKNMHWWLEQHGFIDFHGEDWYETLYWQRDLPNGLQEHHIWWRAFKHPAEATVQNKFFKFFFKINFQTIAVSKAEIMHQGEKWKLQKSDTILRVECYLIKDFDSAWNQGFWKGIKKSFQQNHYREQINRFEAELYNEAREFQDSIKAFVNLTTHQDPQNFQPPNFLPRKQ